MIKRVLKSLHNVHMCQTVRENQQATADCLAKYYVEEFGDQPNWPKKATRTLSGEIWG